MDVEARADDLVFVAANDEEMAVFVDDGQVHVHPGGLLQDQQDLRIRIEELNTYMARSESFWGLPEAERSRLARQQRAMSAYAAVLEERIQAW